MKIPRKDRLTPAQRSYKDNKFILLSKKQRGSCKSNYFKQIGQLY